MEDRVSDEPSKPPAGHNPDRDGRRPGIVTLIIGACLCLVMPEALAGDTPPDVPRPKPKFGHKTRSIVMKGTLGYGPPGLHPGFPAFGLTYHPGYGFGGYGLGTMAEGGFPNYAGTGYPHPMPPLNRLGKLIPVSFFAGPGGPTPTCPNFFAPTEAPLVIEPPSVLEDVGMGLGQGVDYGCYTGGLPFAEPLFAPFVTSAASGSMPGQTPSPSAGRSAEESLPLPPPNEPADPALVLGVTADPISFLGEPAGLLLSRVDPGSIAERAGLRPGDLIRSINDRPANKREDLAQWIAGSSGGTLKLRVRSSLDRQERVIAIAIP